MNAATAPSRSMLIVDDDPMVLGILERLARAQGHAVVAVSGGREALALLRQRSFAIVVTDIRMPDVTGWDVIREVRASHPATGVIVMSGFYDIEENAGALQGVVSLNKPFGASAFLAAVAQASCVSP